MLIKRVHHCEVRCEDGGAKEEREKSIWGEEGQVTVANMGCGKQMGQIEILFNPILSLMHPNVTFFGQISLIFIITYKKIL